MPQKKNKIKKLNINQSSSLGINPTKIESTKGISFSYTYFQYDNNKFSIKDKDAKYLQTLLQRLRDLSSMTVNEMTVKNAKNLRCHPINWKDTTENGFGLLNEEQLVDTPYQFQLSSNEYGRVHGFFIENVFYIVWLDPDHKLYS